MEYHLINEDKSFGGITKTQPTHANWTNKPYLGGFVKEFWNGDDWTEGATQEEIAEATKPEVPFSVSKRQLKQALVLSGVPLQNIDFAIDQIENETDRMLMQIFWNDSNDFERLHPKLIEFSKSLEMSGTQADSLFILASTL